VIGYQRAFCAGLWEPRPMDQESTAVPVGCPDCGTATRLDVDLTKCEFVGNDENLPVQCPGCHRKYDAAAEAGTYSTINGRLFRHP
jgi:hypothetical protein